MDHRNKRTNNDDNDDATTDGTTGGKGMIILGHGIGTSLTIFDELSLILIQSGFSVLRYDYFGHGYSRYIADEDNSEGGIDMWMKYTPDMFVARSIGRFNRFRIGGREGRYCWLHWSFQWCCQWDFSLFSLGVGKTKESFS